jgi:hypothetical protein
MEPFLSSGLLKISNDDFKVFLSSTILFFGGKHPTNKDEHRHVKQGYI